MRIRYLEAGGWSMYSKQKEYNIMFETRFMMDVCETAPGFSHWGSSFAFKKLHPTFIPKSLKWSEMKI